MRRLLLIFTMMIPVFTYGYGDHRGHNLDSLETVLSSFTPDALGIASDKDKAEYAAICSNLAWGYLQLDGTKSSYYAKQALKISTEQEDPETAFDVSILIGQVFWAKEMYDSAAVYYGIAADNLNLYEEAHNGDDPHDLEAMQSRLWGTLGNFYAAQDSVEQFIHYYGKAGEIFEKWGWNEDCSTLHVNMGEVYADHGDLKRAKAEYDKGLDFAKKSGDSLMIAKAMYGLGRWYNDSGKTAKALKYLSKADEYYGNHPMEESVGRADTLAVMSDSYKKMYRYALVIAVSAILIIVLSIIAFAISENLKKVKKELKETREVLDETIEEIRPESPDKGICFNGKEKQIASLMVQGKSTKEIAEEVNLGINTILWYRKRLYTKLGVHSVAAFASEVLKRKLLEEDRSE